MLLDGSTTFQYLFGIFQALQGFVIFYFRCLKAQTIWEAASSKMLGSSASGSQRRPIAEEYQLSPRTKRVSHQMFQAKAKHRQILSSLQEQPSDACLTREFSNARSARTRMNHQVQSPDYLSIGPMDSEDPPSQHIRRSSFRTEDAI